MKNFLRYRTYHDCAMSTFTQAASIAAWQDEQHVTVLPSSFLARDHHNPVPYRVRMHL